MANTEKKPFGPFLHGPPQFGFIISRIINLIEILIYLIDPFLYFLLYFTSRSKMNFALWICFYIITVILFELVIGDSNHRFLILLLIS